MSNKNAVVVPEKIHLVTMNIFKANLETTDDYLENPPKEASFKFGFTRNIAHNLELGRSRFRLFFSLEAQDPEEKPLGAKIEYGIEFHFLIDNFQEFIRPSEKEEVEIDISIIATLFGMAYSTARGIVFERTRGTFFDGVVLPVIDPYKALMEEGKLSKSK